MSRVSEVLSEERSRSRHSTTGLCHASCGFSTCRAGSAENRLFRLSVVTGGLIPRMCSFVSPPSNFMCTCSDQRQMRGVGRANAGPTFHAREVLRVWMQASATCLYSRRAHCGHATHQARATDDNAVGELHVKLLQRWRCCECQQQRLYPAVND